MIVEQSEPIYNAETIYASLIGIIFVIGVVWYLLFFRPDFLDFVWRGLREDVSHMRVCAREDWERGRKIWRGEKLEEVVIVEDDLKCASCGRPLVNGVIIAKGFYCANCAMTPAVIAKAQEQFKNGKV